MRWRIPADGVEFSPTQKTSQETVDAAPPGHPNHQEAARNLALALTQRASRTQELRHVNRALQANRYLLEILSVSSPQRARAQLESTAARSLISLGTDLLGMGRQDEALAATEQAVAILRRLAETNPAACDPDLAGSLINLGQGLSRVGRQGEALAATEEAVAILRRLAETNPAVYEHDLAGSLQNLGIGLSGVGRLTEALAAVEQAAAIRQRLAETTPGYESDLAHSLSILDVLRRVVGDEEKRRQQ